MRPFLKHVLCGSFGAGVGFLVAAWPANAVTLSNVPLFLTTPVNPNVMLMVDNSGSMDNIVPDSPYDAATTYLASCPGANILAGGAAAPALPADGDTFDVVVKTDGTVKIKKSGSFYTYGTAAGQKCFDPSLRYNARLHANNSSTSTSTTTCGSGNTPCYYPGGTLTDSIYTGNYLNWYLGSPTAYSSAANFGANARRKSGTSTRMEVARTAAKSLVDNLAGVRLGLATYGSSGSGGSLLELIEDLSATKKTAVKAEIDGLSADTYTPLAETLADIGRYFTYPSTSSLKLHPGQANESTQTVSNIFNNHSIANNTGATIVAPIQYSCQKSFAVLLTDGRPTSDRGISTYLADYDGDCISPVCTTTVSSTTGYDRKTGRSYEADSLGPSDYLDDVAQALYEMDLRPDLTKTGGAKNNLVTYTIGFSDEQVMSDPLIQETATQGGGQFLTAANSGELLTALEAALEDVIERSSSAAALATNSTRLGTDTVIYQAKFNSGDWSGQLVAYSLTSTGALGSEIWDASATGKIPAAASRNIKTWSGTAGIDFLWASLTGTQKNAIDLANAANTSSPVLDYLRGDQSNEVKNGGSYRNRSKRLGDIINSDPVFVYAPDFGYGVLTEGLATGATPYSSFVNTNKSRTKMIYVGANDGMLHAFDATTGEEKFAYVPNEVTGNLSLLKDTAYAHKYYADGSPFVGDAFVSSAWKTVLLGTTGAGGKAVFALDVTSPNTFTTTQVLWEFTHSELGNTIGQPVIARLAYNNRWAAIFGNGYNSTAGTAKLFMVFLDANPADGWQAGKDADYMVFDTDSTTNNGLATPTLYDSNGDKVVDTVYAGDMQGNVWKFDISGTNTNAWGVAYKSGSTPKPLFTARNASNQVQPITAPVEIGAPPAGKTGVMIYFGTGRFFATGDNTNLEVQSLYGVLDAGAAITTTNRSELQQQTILYEGTDTGTTGRTATTTQIRVLSNTAVNWTTKKGWYLDLVQPPSSTAQGERVISIPLLRHGRVIFTTLVPSTDPCQFGGTSWIMEMDALTGGRLSESVFDLNNDSNFNATDYVTVTVGGVEITVPVSAVKSTVGIIKTPTVVTAGTVEYKLASGTTGEISSTKEKSSAQGTGRVSWRELMD